MPILTLMFKKNKIDDYPLQKGKSLTIGRRSSNDIVIENLAVSGHHAKVDSIGDGFVLTDLQSKNGCFVNEQLITSHWLKHGDVVKIGKHNLVFSYRNGEPRPEEAAGHVDQTMVMETNGYRELVAKSAAGAANGESTGRTADAGKATRMEGVLAYLSGGEGEVVLTRKLTKIGKDGASDIVVSGFGIGATAATISLRPNGFYLSHVGGFFKIKVNGEAVKESVRLKEFDVIEIGSVKMQFFTRE